MHTIKPKIPAKVLLLPVCLIVGAALLWYAYDWLKPDNYAARLVGESADVGAEAVLAGEPVRLTGRTREDLAVPTLESYVRDHTPLLYAAPWTTPAYMAKNQTQSQPEIFCMSSERRCTCLTEQGTRYRLGDDTCRLIAREGPAYNPYKPPRVSAPAHQQRQPQETALDGVRRVVGTSGAARIGSAYIPPERVPAPSLSGVRD